MNLFYFFFVFISIAILSLSNADDNTSPNSGLDNIKTELPLDEIRDFVEIFNKVKTDYVEALNDSNLMEKALRGLISELDPHSSFLSEEHYTDLRENTSGKFGGLGIEIGLKKDAIIVISPIDDTPAEKAGILPGDIITKVDNSPVGGLGIENAARRIKGPPGTKVSITLERTGHSKALNFEIKRALIDNKSVTIKKLPPGYLYVRISQFQTSTGNELATKLTKFSGANADKLTGMILDLRNNPGGVLSGAVAVSDALLAKGLIVYTKGRHPTAELKYSASKEVLIADIPIITLINEGSASASEIVAGALQDNGRAIVVGRPSFGKGSVQTVYPMGNKTAVKLTTAWYYTPSGRSIQATGIVPDIIIEKFNLVRSGQSKSVKEADLNRHLINVSNNLEKHTEFSFPQLAKQDFELYQAVKLLKTMVITTKQQN